MINTLFNRMLELPLWLHIALVVLSFLATNLIYNQLEAYYLASMHPKSHPIGQLAFSGETIKGYFTKMLAGDTLKFYQTSQYIDFAFIFSFACLGLFLSTLIARFYLPSSKARKVVLFAGVAILIAALCDVIEDAISLIMIANPTDFPNWLALPYSTFASIKFVLLVLGVAALLIALVFCVIGRLKDRADIG